MKILRIIAIAVLFITTVGALYGGWKLMTDPGGQSLQLSLSYLEHTPFTNYLYPGIILFFANGVFCLIVLIATLMKWNYHERFIIAQGVLLTGWIFIQVIMIQIVYYLHFVYAAIGLYLILYGFIVYAQKKSERPHDSISSTF